jgi:hypothetical protein
MIHFFCGGFRFLIVILLLIRMNCFFDDEKRVMTDCAKEIKIRSDNPKQ